MYRLLQPYTLSCRLDPNLLTMSFENFNKFLEEWWDRKDECNATMTKNNLEQACKAFRKIHLIQYPEVCMRCIR